MFDGIEADGWTDGAAYDVGMGRWSRSVAEIFLGWLNRRPGLTWLDVGCGTGALTATILAKARPERVLAVDPSAAFLAHARAVCVDPRIAFESGEMEDIPAPDGSFDAVVSGLALNFVDRPRFAMPELRRVAKPGAVVAAYVWDYGGRMEPLRKFWEAATECDPDATEFDETRRFEDCDPEHLSGLFEGAGFDSVETKAIDLPLAFENFETCWRAVATGCGPAPSYAASLDDGAREALKRAYRQALCPHGGGVRATARAWAVRAVT
ncbi:MAG: methyltransferase domain-containing protein [Rhodospirillaceae bacterium]|nr:methyltransferase domain-containing protein [Rhodospirillaceae bacterium]